MIERMNGKNEWKKVWMNGWMSKFKLQRSSLWMKASSELIIIQPIRNTHMMIKTNNKYSHDDYNQSELLTW